MDSIPFNRPALVGSEIEYVCETIQRGHISGDGSSAKKCHELLDESLSVFHYLPLHLSAMGRRFGYKEGDCPVTEEVSARLLRLPFCNDLQVEQQEQICTAICKVSYP